ncbi:hypothetical protein TGPRC2_366750 [Toxoplasma gondii TgCatPRC2]|uniref:Uncharacterized protein n=1 Tax=Toxoplasma gondii TgCatPRC2 TaxID=1130821 RepID=A0A151H7P1_TOXGO|nr:hypothetical protein TGPRC2_366750 [Toxoplasma gondii TgCatPRC2]
MECTSSVHLCVAGRRDSALGMSNSAARHHGVENERANMVFSVNFSLLASETYLQRLVDCVCTCSCVCIRKCVDVCVDLRGPVIYCVYRRRCLYLNMQKLC